MPLAVVRRRASRRELPQVIPAACGEVWSVLKAHNVPGAGRHVALYLDGVFNLEIGVEISEAFTGACAAAHRRLLSAEDSARVTIEP